MDFGNSIDVFLSVDFKNKLLPGCSKDTFVRYSSTKSIYKKICSRLKQKSFQNKMKKK